MPSGLHWKRQVRFSSVPIFILTAGSLCKTLSPNLFFTCFDFLISRFGICFVIISKLMKQDLKRESSKSKLQMFGEINAEASLWVLLPKAFAGIGLSAVVVLLRFWSEFGEVSLYAFGFAAFIVVLEILIIVGLRFQNRTERHTTKPLRNNWLDKIGAWWLVACAFGAFFGWICGNLATAFPDSALFFLPAEILFTIILPVATMLPNLRYLSRNSAVIQVPILVFITFLPLLVGISSLFTLWNSVRR